MSRRARRRAAQEPVGRRVPKANLSRPGAFTTPSQRPRAPWHPVPAGELLMLAGLVLMMAGLLGAGSGIRMIAAGLGTMTLGVLELTLREHLSGYRSHRALLALLAAVVMHMLLVVFSPIKLIGPGALALDLAVFGASYALFDALWKRSARRRTTRQAR